MLILTAMLLVAGPGDPVENDVLTLWYKQPATEWNEALPLGNGRLGAMVFGGVGNERIQFNEDTLWDGYERDQTNPQARAALEQVQRLIFEGQFEEATERAQQTMLGVPPHVQSYQSFGDLRIEFPGAFYQLS